MRTALYIIWFGTPLLFFLLALYGRLEQLSGKIKTDNSSDLFKQGLFVLAAAGICLLVDQTVLAELSEDVLPSWLPPLFLQIVLFPAVLYAGALLLGPSKQIRIERASRPTERHRRPR